MLISISRYLALVLGVLTPLAETIRRWSTWRENPPTLFDDYILGAFLLYGAWRVGKDVRSGQRFLAAAWAFMCGMAYLSFFANFTAIVWAFPIRRQFRLAGLPQSKESASPLA